MPKVEAVFLDRDGVLNTHLPERYVENPEQLEVVNGVPEAIRRLNGAGIPVIVISNQQGVGRGIMTATDLAEVMDALAQRIYASAGARIDDVFICPHLKTDSCSCRKPKPGMILDASSKHHVDPANTVFVGDSATDLQAASAAGVGHKILVLSGANKFYSPANFKVQPDYVFPTLTGIVDWILEVST